MDKLSRIQRSLDHGEGSIWIEGIIRTENHITIPIWIKGFPHEKINDFVFCIRFIISDIRFISASKGSGTKTWQQIGGSIKGNNPSILTVGGYAGGAQPLEDTGCWQLCKVRFKVLRTGATFIILEDYGGDIHKLNPREYRKTIDLGY